VLGFISKPITLENIRDLLKKAEISLDNEYLTDANLSQLSAFYQENLPIIRENELYSLSKMSEVTPANRQRLLSSNINLFYPYFIMCIFDFDELPEGDMERYDLAFSSIRKFVGEELDDLHDYDFFNRYEKLCLILKSTSAPDVKGLERRIERVIQRAGRFSEMPVSAGLSNIFHENTNFSAMVKEANRALGYRSVMGGGKVFSFENSLSPAMEFTTQDNKIKELGYFLRSQTTESCLERIDLIRSSLSSSRNSLYYAATGILNVLIRGCDDLEGLYSRNGGPDMLYRRLFEIKTDDEVYDYLKEMVSIIRVLNENVIVDNMERNLRLVVAYMDSHFCDTDISFESLARDVNFSVSYISTLLRKKLNTSFVKMLTDLRMEKAKELLSNPALKIIDIAEQLGYNDPYYFSHCFKKHIGLPPKEFRNK